MSKASDLFHHIIKKIGETYSSVESGQMFGKLCAKINGKAFIAFFQEEMVFKLDKEDNQKALALKEAKLWDPSGKKRPMKEWVQIPFSHSKKWKELADQALNYVKGS